MNRKKLFSVLITVLALGGAIAGTLAFFTARRTVSTNRFQQGTLDLSVDGNAGVDPFVIENLGETANIEGTKTWTIVNTGTLPGRLLVRIKNLKNNENACNDQEIEVEANCESDAVGELGKVMNLRLSLDGTEVVSSYLADADESTIGTAWKALPVITLQPNDTVTVKADWNVSEDAYGNEIQSDDLTFDMDFRLIQQIEGDIEN